MRRLGLALHVSKSKRLIVKAEVAAPLMSDVLGPDLEHIGIVSDVLGPVKSPYVAVKPDPGVDAHKYIGKILLFKPPRRTSRPRRGGRRGWRKVGRR